MSIRSFLHVDEFIETYQGMSRGQVLFAVVAALMVVAGNAGQLIILNLWVNTMGDIPPPFTVLTISATTMALGFGCAILIRRLTRPVSISFLLCPKAIALTIAIGLCNASNGVLLVYATQPTPEILQALLLCTGVFWTLIFSKLFLRTNQNIFHPLVIISFLLVAGGILLGAEPQFASDTPTNGSTKYWSMIFALSMVPGALYNVFASMYMRSFTAHDDTASDDADVESGGVLQHATNVHHHYAHYAANSTNGSPVPLLQQPVAQQPGTSDDTTVKLTMLATTGVSQVIWMFVFLPIDSAPWFGSSSSIAATRTALSEGWACVLLREYGCNHTFAYYIGFNLAYFINYMGSAYLNHFSATLNSMVTQISSPVASIVLLSFPTLNIAGQLVAAGPCVGGVILLLIGSVLYTLWEQGSRRRATPSSTTPVPAYSTAPAYSAAPTYSAAPAYYSAVKAA